MNQIKEDNLLKKLSKEIEIIDWAGLKSHHQRNALFILAKEFDLAQVALEIANDDVTKIQSYQQNNQLRKPSSQEVEQWNENKKLKFANFLVIQPFVLISLLKSH